MPDVELFITRSIIPAVIALIARPEPRQKPLALRAQEEQTASFARILATVAEKR
jgi:hypothetical protein